MPNFNKFDLMEMSDADLLNTAHDLGIFPTGKETKEEVVYQIINEQAARGAAAPTPRHRQRISKPKEAEHIVSANQNESKSLEKNKKKKTSAKTTEKKVKETQETDTAAPATAEKVEAPKKRTRTTKKAKEAPEQLQPVEGKTLFDEAPITEEAIEETITLPETQQPESIPATEPDSNANDENEPDFIIIQDVHNLENEIDEGYTNNISDKGIDNYYNETENADYTPVNPAPSNNDFSFDDIIIGSGVLEVAPENYGFLRSSDYNYLSSPDDIYVSQNIIKSYGLSTGDVIEGTIRIPKENEKYFSLSHINKINGRLPHEVRDRVAFEHLTPLFPDEKFTLCNGRNDNLSVRMVDLFTPIGKGQRALIVAQPKTGKTTLMKDIANAIAANNPGTYLMMLLIDERPEEVTDMSRTVNAEVIASTFDEPASQHVKIAGLVLEKAKRMVECGHDVVIFLDSITRLARAYNTVAPASGKVLTGGVDSNALQKPKRFFGAARNIEGGGSLTIIATALIDTGSKMDEVIFEEFKGTGNMELQLDRTLSNKRIFPSINCVASSTRRDDLLQDDFTRDRMWIMRKFIADMKPIEAITKIMEILEKTKNNEEFLVSMNS